MASFFNTERVQAGWRFFLLWMLMTLLGLGLGAAIEYFIFSQINGIIAVFFASITQAWVLNRHVSIYIPWAVSAMVAWWLAALLTGGTIAMLPMDMPEYVPLAIVAVLAGVLAGILHFFFLKEWLPVGIWWLAVAAFSWLSFGLIPAIVLTIILSRDAVAMEGRWFMTTEQMHT